MVTLLYIASKLRFLGYTVETRSRNELELINIGIPSSYTYSETGYCKNDYVYIFFEKYPSDIFSNLGSVIVYSSQRPNELSDTMNYIWVKNGRGKKYLIEDIQNIFDEYSRWKNGMMSILINHRSLQELVDISYPIFHNPMYVLDNTQTTLACSKNIITKLNNQHWKSISEYGYVSEEIMEELVETSDVDYLRGLRAPVFFSHKTKPYRCITTNVLINGRGVCSFSVLEVDMELNSAFLDIAQEFVDCATTLIKSESMYYISHTTLYETWIIDMLENKVFDDKELEYRLSLESWKRHDRYCVLLFSMNSDKQTSGIFAYYCNLISRYLPGSKSYIYNDRILTILRIASGSDYPSFIDLQAFVQRTSLHCGISNLFDDFSNLCIHYDQANYALKCAYAGRDFSYFKDCISQYLCKDFKSNERLEYFIDQNILKLWEYDRDHHSDLVNTLYHYMLKMGNLKKCSDILRIHRNTLLYRLNKITEIIGLSVTDSDNIMPKLLSCAVLLNQNKPEAR